MGYMRHNAIVVTTHDETRAYQAHRQAEFLGLQVTGVIAAPVNTYYTFLVGPDGSKEGWDESDRGDKARTAFLSWLDEQRYGDGSSPFAWAELQYGDGERWTAVTRHSDEPYRQFLSPLKIQAGRKRWAEKEEASS